MPAYVVESICKGCGSCARICPRGAITLVGGKAVVDPELCDECELCLEECINGALTFLRTEEQPVNF